MYLTGWKGFLLRSACDCSTRIVWAVDSIWNHIERNVMLNNRIHMTHWNIKIKDVSFFCDGQWTQPHTRTKYYPTLRIYDFWILLRSPLHRKSVCESCQSFWCHRLYAQQQVVLICQSEWWFENDSSSDRQTCLLVKKCWILCQRPLGKMANH